MCAHTQLFRVEFRKGFRMSKPLVSIVIVTYNRRKDTLECLESIYRSDYQNIEVILVDNNSSDGLVEAVSQHYPQVNLVANSYNAMAAKGRNIGVEKANGELLLFIDADNIIDPQMISHLVESAEMNMDVALLGPLMFYHSNPKNIWWAGAEINLWSSRTTYLGKSDIDHGQYQDIQTVGHIPNVFMCRSKIFEQVKGFEEYYGIMFEESDLAEKIKKLGFKVIMNPKAKTYHKVPFENDPSQKLRYLGMETKFRTFLVARNRLFYLRRHATFLQYLFFMLTFFPLFSLYYSFMVGRHGGFGHLRTYWKGLMEGLTLPLNEQTKFRESIAQLG